MRIDAAPGPVGSSHDDARGPDSPHPVGEPDVVAADRVLPGGNGQTPDRVLEPMLSVAGLRVVIDTPQGALEVLDDLSFTLRKGEIGCLLGPSGCGKTTALRTIAGFTQPAAGEILLAGRRLTTGRDAVAAEKRGVGIVFQDFALFPHLSVTDNVAFGLHKRTRSERDARVRHLLELVGLPDIGRRFPHELSGGQQQRVALARALAPSPSLLLLDEPFSNLDPDLRERLAMDLRELLRKEKTTALLVTHDQYEAFALADRVGVMQAGRIAQWDTPYRLYHQPATRGVADFVGLGVFLPGRLIHRDGLSSVELELGTLPISARGDQALAGASADLRGEVVVLLRPDDIVHDPSSPMRAVIIRKAFRGAQFLYTLRLPSGTELLALVPSHHDHAIGEAIGVRFAADHVVTFSRSDDGDC